MGFVGLLRPESARNEPLPRRVSGPRLAEGAMLRPWLQAFWWTDAQIRSSIQAAEDRGVGWLLWNVGSSFSPAAIPTDDEIAGVG